MVLQEVMGRLGRRVLVDLRLLSIQVEILDGLRQRQQQHR